MICDIQDLKHSVRILAKNRGFTCVAVLSIGIGVGANAAMVSLADGLLLRPLAVPRPAEVLTVAAVPRAQGLRNPVMVARLCGTGQWRPTDEHSR